MKRRKGDRNENEKLYMEHEKNGTTYVYDVTVIDGASGEKVATFTDPHGFSTFTLTKSAPTAKIGNVGSYAPSAPSTSDSAVETPTDEQNTDTDTDTDTDVDAIAAVEAAKLSAQTKLVKVKGRTAVKITWKSADGSDLDLDGVEIFRSVKRNSGYTSKPIFKTTKAQYYNTSVKAGIKYYYKIRGYKVIDGETVYTGFSTKAWRTVMS